jgi:flagellar hook-length control protein FliK
VTDPELAARQTPSAADSRARVGEHADVAMAARATTASAQSAGRAAAPQLGVLTSLLADVTRGATRARMAQGMAQGMARGEPASRPLSTTASTLDFAAHGIRGSLRTLDASAATMLDAASLRAALASGAVSTGPQQAESAATALEAAVLESDATGAEDAEPVPVAARAPLRAGAGPVPVSFSAPGTIDADAPGEDGIAGAATQSLPGHAGQSGATPGQPGAGVSPLPLAEASAPARADTGSANAPSAPATDLTATAHPPVTVSGGTIEAGPLGDRLIALAQHGQLQAKLRLHPAELGALEVRIKLHDDGASVAISSPHGQVRDAIEASLPRLRELFAAQGMNLVDVDVSSGGGNAPHGDGESLRHREAAVRHAVGTSEAAQPRAAMPDRAPVHERTHRIDLLA